MTGTGDATSGQGRNGDAGARAVRDAARDHPSASALTRIAIAVAVGLLVWILHPVLLVLFLAVLFACVLRGMVDWLSTHLRLPPAAGLPLVGVLLLLALAGITYWIVPKLAQEASDLVQRVTQEWHQLSSRFGLGGGGEGVQNRLGQVGNRLARPFVDVVGSSLELAAGIVIIVAVGFFCAAAPDVYVHGVLHLAPPDRRARLDEGMRRLGSVLRRWLLGQLVDMVVVGVLSAIGLIVIGVPVPYALGLIAGLFTFIPYFGAFLGGIPAVMVALTVGWHQAVYTVGVYVICHFVEGYVVSPLVQRRLVELPPALTVSAMAVAGTLFGPLGFVVGTPLVAVAMVAVRMFYVEDVLGDHSADGGRF